MQHRQIDPALYVEAEPRIGRRTVDKGKTSIVYAHSRSTKGHTPEVQSDVLRPCLVSCCSPLPARRFIALPRFFILPRHFQYKLD
jgi:hypothetical protein